MYRASVPSVALARWRSERANRVDELMRAHSAVGGGGPGRRVGTVQLNWSMALRLAAEFQGYSRDLHDIAVDHLTESLAPKASPLASILRTNLTHSRDLDRGNAQPRSLARDFGRLGFQLWPALALKDARSERWKRALEALNQARNAIAHADDRKLATLATEGWPMQLRTIRSWRASLDSLATCMDLVVADSLAAMTGKRAPW